MTTLEKSMVSQATPADLKMVKAILYQMKYQDSYYGQFTKYSLTLDYKEYQTLKNDLDDFSSKLVLLHFQVSISEIHSLLKSFIMLKDRYKSNISCPFPAFENFLNSSIAELTKFINQLVEPI
jgi:hypothetical protein